MSNSDEKYEKLLERIAELEALVPARESGSGESRAPHEIQSCPRCSSTLEKGRVTIHGTSWGFIFVGFSYQHVWFRADQESAREQIVLDHHATKWAFRCLRCRTLVMLDETRKA